MVCFCMKTHSDSDWCHMKGSLIGPAGGVVLPHFSIAFTQDFRFHDLICHRIVCYPSPSSVCLS